MDNRILYLDNPKEGTKNLLGLIKKLSKFAGARSIYKNQLYFYTLAVENPKQN